MVKSSGPMTVLYDLTICPSTFDFVNFLAISSAVARGRGLHVIVNAPTVRNIGIEAQHSVDHVQMKFRNVILKLLSMCDWVKSFEVNKNQHELGIDSLHRIEFPPPEDLRDLANKPWHSVFKCLPVQLEELYSAGVGLPSRGFRANSELVTSYASFMGPNAIIFHPRASRYNTNRNTPLTLFSQLADSLRGEGFDCFFIGDAEAGVGDGWLNSGIASLPGGAFDLEHRLAASSAARFNVCWNGGAMVPFQYSEVPFVSFGTFNSMGGAVTSRDFFDRKGPIFGRNPSWYVVGAQWIDWTDAQSISPQYMRNIVLELMRRLQPVTSPRYFEGV
jgi:hypothetical protein